MFARISTYRAEDADKLVQGFDRVTDPLEALEGFSHAYFLVDRASGKGMSMTVWHTEEALNASVAKADEMRKQATDSAGGTIEAVEHYEVALTIGSAVTAR